MNDHEIDIRKYRDSLNDDVTRWQDAIVDDEDDEAVEEAEAQLDTFALEASVQHRFRVLLTAGGPTVWLEADIEGEPGDWERTGEITLHHSWGTLKEIPVWGETALATYFDNTLEGA